MIFNLISKNNGVNGAVIKNNGTEVFTPVVGTIYSCTKDLLPKSAGINDFIMCKKTILSLLDKESENLSRR